MACPRWSAAAANADVVFAALSARTCSGDDSENVPLTMRPGAIGVRVDHRQRRVTGRADHGGGDGRVVRCGPWPAGTSRSCRPDRASATARPAHHRRSPSARRPCCGRSSSDLLGRRVGVRRDDQARDRREVRARGLEADVHDARGPGAARSAAEGGCAPGSVAPTHVLVRIWKSRRLALAHAVHAGRVRARRQGEAGDASAARRRRSVIVIGTTLALATVPAATDGKRRRLALDRADDARADALEVRQADVGASHRAAVLLLVVVLHAAAGRGR